MILRKAPKEYLFIFISFGLSFFYSIFAVLFASGWSTDLNILFAIFAATFSIGYLLLIQLNTFKNKGEEFVYLAGIICFLMPVIYGIGQADPLLIRESLSSVYFFIFFSGILAALKRLIHDGRIKGGFNQSLKQTSAEIKGRDLPIDLNMGEFTAGSYILVSSGAVFEVEDVSGIPGRLFFTEGSEIPVGAKLLSPTVARLEILNVSNSEQQPATSVYIKSIQQSLKAMSERYMVLLLLSLPSLAALLLSHFPYYSLSRLSLWFQLAGSAFFVLYLILQLRQVASLCIDFALMLFKNGCQIFDFQRVLELLFRVKNFRLKLARNTQSRILSEIRIIDEQVSGDKLQELLFYLIADSKNPDFAMIRSHLQFSKINPASFGLIQKRIETPTGITAWLDNKKLFLGNEAFIIQNGVFVNASEYLSFDSSNSNIFFAIDQELLAGFILEKISEEHLKEYASKLKGSRVLIDSAQQVATEKHLSHYGLTIKSRPSADSAPEAASQSTEDLKLLLAESVFNPSEIADIYFPQPNWERLSRFFFGIDRLRKVLVVNAAVIFLLFLMIFSAGTLLLLSQMVVLITAIFMASLSFQHRFLQSNE